MSVKAPLWLIGLVAMAALAVPAAAWAQGEDDLEDEEDLEGFDDLEDEEDLEDAGDLEKDVEKEDDLEKGGFGSGDAAAPSGDSAEVVDGTFVGEGRFFVRRPLADRSKTAVAGSLTSSSLFFHELGVEFDESDRYDDTRAASQRIFTDLRGQLTAAHIAGSSWWFRGDVRGRFSPDNCGPEDEERDLINPCTRYQSGTFGGDETEIRELHISRRTGSSEAYVGRQYVLDLAAHRLDGIQLRLVRSPRLTLIAFAGLHPQKASRDLRQDYPESAPQTDGSTKRIMPATGGAGVAYRLERLYGAFGGVAVVPLVEESMLLGGDGQLEDPRIFLTSNGYYRRSAALDLYHYAVLDVAGSAGPALTNVTVGVNYRPSPVLRTYVQVNHLDTETLTALTQTQLNTPSGDADQIQNNIEVLRIAQDSARVGISGSLSERRYELSTSVALRRRPEVTLTSPDGNQTLVLAAAQDIEALIRFVDRESYAGSRLGAQVSRSFGIGEDRFQRASTLSVRADISKPVMDGKAELEGHAMVIQSTTVGSAQPGTNCSINPPGMGGIDPNTFEACFGDGSALTATVGGLAFYRISTDLMGVFSATLAAQKLEPSENIVELDVPSVIYPISAFLRLAYRF